jgi:hypothetical protein
MKNIQKNTRNNIKDIWNAFMVDGADFSTSKYDIPLCPTTTKINEIPTKIITYREAVNIYNKISKKDKNFKIDACVCFYEDDQNFDGKRKGIWSYPKNAFNILKHFSGIITPDFSTYQDFPVALKIYNTYRMRAFGYWYGKICKKKIINNVRWGTKETYKFCFDGIPKNSIVAIGTVGGSPFKILDRKRFEEGLYYMVKKLNPCVIIVYGSANYPCFKKLKSQGIKILEFPSKTNSYFNKRRKIK